MAAVDAFVELPLYNLYSNGQLIDFPNEGEQILTRELIVFKGDENDSYHIVKHYDTVDSIAYLAYNDTIADSAKTWWAICDANNIYNPFDLTEYVGKSILIPNPSKLKILT